MKLRRLAPILLTPFLAACPKPIELGPTRPPQDRFVCAEEPRVPPTAKLQEYVAPNGAKVYLKDEVDKRDSTVSDLIVSYRGAWFSCKNQLRWHETYWDKSRGE